MRICTMHHVTGFLTERKEFWGLMTNISTRKYRIQKRHFKLANIVVIFFPKAILFENRMNEKVKTIFSFGKNHLNSDDEIKTFALQMIKNGLIYE